MPTVKEQNLIEEIINESLHFDIPDGGQLSIEGNVGSFPSFISAYIFRRSIARNTIIVVPEKESSVYYDLKSLIGGERVFLFPEWDIVPYQNSKPNSEIIGRRLRTLWHILNDSGIAVVATPKSLLQPTLHRKNLQESSFILEEDQEFPLNELTSQLVKCGYKNSSLVEYTQNFAQRGSIVDIFSYQYKNPIRLEFFGDTIESIRTFDTSTQRSRDELEEAIILPAKEELTAVDKEDLGRFESYFPEIASSYREEFSDAQLKKIISRIKLDTHCPEEIWFHPLFKPGVAYLTDYLKKEDNLIFLNKDKTHQKLEDYKEEIEKRYRSTSERDLPYPKPTSIFLEPNELSKKEEDLTSVKINSLSSTDDVDISFALNEHPSILGEEDILKDKTEYYLEKNYDICIACENVGQKKRLSKILEPYDVNIINTHLSEGFILKDLQYAVLTDHQIFDRYKSTYQARWYYEGQANYSFRILEEGDYVVHTEYGIGKFLGIENFRVDDNIVECLELEYADEEKLYVPVENFYLVQKYLGEKANVKLSKLGGKRWSKKKAKAKKAINKLAGELMHLYAMRKTVDGFACDEDGEMQKELEESFIYEETDDQLQAIKDVKEDLESNDPMDRLLCGDVGFGKTEVALRAAFKMVANGKQVAVLVPTTILARQHYQTFSERLKDFPVFVEGISRFRSSSEEKEILDKLSAGETDIIIGTHRLLSNDIQFDDLGLLIVDEEQRFGVEQKETIKKMKTELDVLSMTATPIPRTLYFSISGLRDMSQIDTPPKLRHPVITRVSEFDEEVIKDAINREFNRGGQAFFVHNRVQTIHKFAAYLRDLMPHVDFGIAHGQMDSVNLEKVMMNFLNEEYDVLVTTTIIENGTDIPNVNTLLVNRADKFGLSQLYQLRGRVGRSTRQAHAYLFTPPKHKMGTDAKKRLKSIMQHTELGSGFGLAMKDLEIRGAGNILGKEQSGFIEEIGLDLYSKMMKEAIAALKDESPDTFDPAPLDIGLDTYIPEDYIPSPKWRVYFYQKLYMTKNEKQLNDLRREMIDRFGEIPDKVRTLTRFIKLRILSDGLSLNRIVGSEEEISFIFEKEFTPKWKKLNEFILPLQLNLQFRDKTLPKFILFREDNKEDIAFLQDACRVLNALEKYLNQEEQ